MDTTPSLPVEFHRNETNKQRMRFKKDFLIFLPSEVLGIPCTIFNSIIQVTLMSFAMQNSRRPQIWRGRGDFQNRILVNECCLNANVFMVIEILREKWWKMGQRIHNMHNAFSSSVLWFYLTTWKYVSVLSDIS